MTVSKNTPGVSNLLDVGLGREGRDKPENRDDHKKNMCGIICGSGIFEWSVCGSGIFGGVLFVVQTMLSGVFVVQTFLSEVFVVQAFLSGVFVV